jgi:hypothetical protein
LTKDEGQKFYIVAAGLADGSPCHVVGQYLKSFDVDFGDDGGEITGRAVWTADVSRAKSFANYAAAFAEWNQQSKRIPFRADGKPNKPLTAFSVEVVKGTTE